jgi:hypothetical protein
MEDSKVWATFKVDSGGNLELVEKYKKQANWINSPGIQRIPGDFYFEGIHPVF